MKKDVRCNIQILQVSLCLLGFFLNLIITIILFRRKKIRNSKEMTFILNSFLANIIICLGNGSFHMYQLNLLTNSMKEATVDEYWKHLITCAPIKVFTFTLLALNLLVLSLDRLITVKWSFWYRSRVEHKHLVFTSIVIYLLTIIVSVLAYLSKTFNKKNHHLRLRETFSMIITICMLTVLCVTNLILHRVTKKQIIKIKINSIEPNGCHIKQAQKKSSKICFGTTVLFIVMWSPRIADAVLRVKSKNVSLKELFHNISTLCLYLHLIVQTIIYSTINKTTRKRIARFIGESKIEVMNSIHRVGGSSLETSAQASSQTASAYTKQTRIFVKERNSASSPFNWNYTE